MTRASGFHGSSLGLDEWPLLTQSTFDRLHNGFRSVGIKRLLEQWETEDRARDNEARAAEGKPPIAGGRPVGLPVWAVLLVMYAVAADGGDTRLTTIANAVRYRLTPSMRTTLGLPAQEPMALSDRYSQVQSALTRLDKLINAHAGIAGRRRTQGEYFKLVDAIPEARRRSLQARANRLTNLLLDISIRLHGKDTLAGWHGDIAVDGTPVEVARNVGNSKGASRRAGDATRLMSSEPDAGWHTKQGSHGEPTDSLGRPHDLTFAYELHIATTSEPTGPDGVTAGAIPKVVVGMTMGKPGRSLANAASAILASISERGYPAGDFVTDRGYMPAARARDLQLIARNFGYKLVFDYRKDQVGVQATMHGALLVDGRFYTPGMPPRLIDITRWFLHLEDPTDADRKVLEAALAEREKFELQTKAPLNADGVIRLQCPAVGRYATVTCDRFDDRKPDLPRGVRKSLPLTVTSDPSMTGRVCTQDTTSFNIAENDTVAKFYQDYAYGSPEWRRRYQGPRAAVESANASLKDDGNGRLAQSGLRRVRGYGKQCIMIALVVCVTNIRKIARFLDRQRTDSDTPPSKPGTRARRSGASLADFAPPELPLLVPGHGSPPIAA